MKIFCFIIMYFYFVADVYAQPPQLVKNVNPNGGSFTDQAFEIGDTTYLIINDSTLGSELWIFNSNNGTTNLVKDINTGSSSSDPAILGMTNHKLIFCATDTNGNRNLWCSDGSAIGTLKLNNISTSVLGLGVNDHDYCQTDSLFFFIPDDNLHGKEIWVTDGTILGTQLVKDIYPGPTGCNPLNLTKFGNKVLFSAIDTIHGQEPWISDGSGLNTFMVKDIFPGAYDSNPTSFIVMGSYFYFSARSISANVFRSYGSDTSTIALGSIPMTVDNMFYFKHNLYATGNIWYMLPVNNHSPCIAKFDLSTNIGSIVKNFGNIDFTYITFNTELVGDSVFYFGYSDPMGGSASWYRCDGTDIGTLDVGVPDGYLYSYATVLYKDMLCFMHEESINFNFELFIIDGVHMTIKMLDIFQGAVSSYPHKITVFKDRVFFIAKDSIMGNQLFVTEGDISNTFIILPGSSCNYDALPADGKWRLPNTSKHLFFNANYNTIGQELYSFDGSSFPLSTNVVQSVNQGKFVPNPSTGIFKYTEDELPIKFEIFNSLGELITTSEVTQVDLTGYENGVYFVKVFYNNRYYFDKLILSN